MKNIEKLRNAKNLWNILLFRRTSYIIHEWARPACKHLCVCLAQSAFEQSSHSCGNTMCNWDVNGLPRTHALFSKDSANWTMLPGQDMIVQPNYPCKFDCCEHRSRTITTMLVPRFNVILVWTDGDSPTAFLVAPPNEKVWREKPFGFWLLDVVLGLWDTLWKSIRPERMVFGSNCRNLATILDLLSNWFMDGQ